MHLSATASPARATVSSSTVAARDVATTRSRPRAPAVSATMSTNPSRPAANPAATASSSAEHSTRGSVWDDEDPDCYFLRRKERKMEGQKPALQRPAGPPVFADLPHPFCCGTTSTHRSLYAPPPFPHRGHGMPSWSWMFVAPKACVTSGSMLRPLAGNGKKGSFPSSCHGPRGQFSFVVRFMNV